MTGPAEMQCNTLDRSAIFFLVIESTVYYYYDDTHPVKIRRDS